MTTALPPAACAACPSSPRSAATSTPLPPMAPSASGCSATRNGTKHRRYHSLQKYILGGHDVVVVAIGTEPQHAPYNGYVSNPELSLQNTNADDAAVNASKDEEAAAIVLALISDVDIGDDDNGEDVKRDGYVSDPEISQQQVNTSNTLEGGILVSSSSLQISESSAAAVRETTTADEQHAKDGDLKPNFKPPKVHRRYFSLHRNIMDGEAHDAAGDDTCTADVDDAVSTPPTTTTPPMVTKTSFVRADATLHRRFWSLQKQALRTKHDIEEDVTADSNGPSHQSHQLEIVTAKKDLKAERARLHRRWQSLNKLGVPDMSAETYAEAAMGAATSSATATAATEEAPSHPFDLYKSERNNKELTRSDTQESDITLGLCTLDERHLLTTTELLSGEDGAYAAVTRDTQRNDVSTIVTPRHHADYSSTEQSPTSVGAFSLDQATRESSEPTAETVNVDSAVTSTKKKNNKARQNMHRRWQSLYREGLLGDS